MAIYHSLQSHSQGVCTVKVQPKPKTQPQPQSQQTEFDSATRDLARAFTVYFAWKSVGLLDEKP